MGTYKLNLLNILITGPLTGASMNSARTLGPAIAANNYKGIWIYLTAPILGALAGAGIYTAVKLPEEDDRSGDIDDSFIADLVVGLASCQIKAGSPSRGERLAKYNQVFQTKFAKISMGTNFSILLPNCSPPNTFARTYVFSFQGDDCLICRGSRSILLLAAEAENGADLFLST
ncbi:unnamed protein product [Lactuca saligna]|uniref:phosphopyruvate hydratase n=1 Tax=Lactuca saligna TaxID=75948 RepID=A0AA36A0N9_LACSI|nr:unnamed protein product [Lactuca saligna]CAI9301666.1 unnamed protein product [Lactuca saligna]